MPSKNEKQRKLFGAALGCKRTGKCGSKKIRDIAKSVSEKKLKEFARKKKAKNESVVREWKDKLQNVYENFAEFEQYDGIYGLAHRLGYGSAEEAWEANPMVKGGTNPSDYGRVKAEKNKPVTNESIVWDPLMSGLLDEYGISADSDELY